MTNDTRKTKTPGQSGGSRTADVASTGGPVWARLDLDRPERTGLPEVIYADGKTDEQVLELAQVLIEHQQSALATRVHTALGSALCVRFEGSQYFETAKVWSAGRAPAAAGSPAAQVALVTAGSSDGPVAEEALRTALWLGLQVDRYYDVGVAGLDRLLSQLDQLRRADAVIAVAGMDGALPTVVAALVPTPVIAVPTSVGYGASFDGIGPLLTMLTGCAPGVAVVNIDNGFGAAALAHKILR